MILFFCALGAFGQKPTVNNAEFDAELGRLLNDSVPFISVEELRKRLDEFVVLDTREEAEYVVSHIPNARFVGYKKFDEASVDGLSKDTPIVLYCSVGYRSGKVGKKLQKKGFTNVFNLYGSIFEWANKGYPMENANGQKTSKVHTYDEKWSKWVDNPEVEKVW